ncbi:MAG TPA: methyltransferase [Roseiarcus sp.]|jgi:23S rRNA (uracil1939-C5)-methyltransferase|nr:methyltransferase [Roseiarcus sp.]
MSDNATVELTIATLGHRGEGIAKGAEGSIFVPYALPGERVRAAVSGERGNLKAVIESSPERIAPICRHFADCGACAAQHMTPALYATWKRDILIRALAQARVETSVAPLLDAHGEGRRRAVLHARLVGERSAVGYMQARAHRLVAIDECPVLAPAMGAALASAGEIAAVLRKVGKPLDIAVTATMTGLDIDLRGAGALDFSLRQDLVGVADRLDLARLSNHGEIIIERRAPQIAMGAARVAPPPGAFLQATSEGERLLAALTLEAIKGERVADLFCGVGALALRLAERHQVHAVEIETVALAALARAAGETKRLHPTSTEARDLFRRPLTRQELRRFDAIVFDPPRAGAAAQATEIAASGVPSVVAVSCNPATFARDARLLVEGGYRFEKATPIDQFRFSPHVEIVGVFTRPTRKRAKGLLG